MDNLEAQTYETFEKDSVKYIQVWMFILGSSLIFLFIYKFVIIFL